MTRISRAFLLCSVLWLPACNTVDRLNTVGKEPPLSPIENVVEQKGYRPAALPMPQMADPRLEANSLWRTGSRAFFKDQRANKIGDILTVQIDISDQAKVDNATKRSRSNSEKANAANFLGLESQLDKVLPNAVDPSALVNAGSGSESSGAGTVDRSESIKLTVAAVVTQVLPNGNMVINGRQEVRVNFEVRELLVSGVVRPEDISATNTIRHTQIAEARIAYGGRGQITDVQQPRYGQQVFDILFPF